MSAQDADAHTAGSPTSTPTRPQGTPRTRASTSNARLNRTREELVRISNIDTNIFDAALGRTHLESVGYATRGEPTTFNSLAMALLLLSQSTRLPRQITEGMRAIAFLMEDLGESQTAQSTAKRILELINPALERIAAVAADSTEALRSAAVANTNTLQEVREETHELIETLGNTANELAEQGNRLTQTSAQAQATTPQTQTQPPPPPPLSYAAITQTLTPPRHAEVIARSLGRGRQILIERNETTGVDPEEMARLTERELVAKANLAVDTMGDLTTTKPEGTADVFLGAQRLQRGAILYVTTSAEATTWIQGPEVKKAFLNAFGGRMTIRERGHTLIVEFVPTRYDPNSKAAQEEIEDINQFPRNEILMTRYLKDATRRSPGQLTAFIAMTLHTPEAANRVIREGIIIEGKRVFGRKNIQEPRRCMKCQGYTAGHFAADCKQVHDTCARCGRMHRTTNCDKTDEPPFCANCRMAGHTASDRACPTFRREAARILGRNPENRYRYFPIANDPSTWELLDTNGEGTQNPRAETGMAQTEGEARPARNPGAWNGGPRGGQPTRGTSRGRAETGGRGRGGFAPPSRDAGWGGFTTARQLHMGNPPGPPQGPAPGQPGRPGQPATFGRTAPPPQRSQSQSRLDNFFSANFDHMEHRNPTDNSTMSQ